jgi:DNA polymerase-1
MPKINTKNLDIASLGARHRLWVYNALDAAITYEVHEATEPLLDDVSRKTYSFSKSLQAPVLAMMRKGFLVDEDRRQEMLKKLEGEIAFLLTRLDRIAREIWGRGLNPNSPKAVGEFFYDAMRLPEQLKLDKKSGERKRTTDSDALEKLAGYFEASLIVQHILDARSLRKLASMLRTEVRGGRMYGSFNIAGTETGRLSSSSDAFNTGTNLQNQTERLRIIYRADPGKKMASFDCKTGESFVVGVICKLLGLGERYFNACCGGDLHTSTCKLVWPNLPWTGDKKKDRKIADQLFYRHFSYRDMAKKGGHGSNYYGQPPQMAKHLKIETDVVSRFQKKYFEAYPELPAWHQTVAERLQTEGQITTLMGRRRWFFGRLRSDDTLREAIAHEPQSIQGDFTNTWMKLVHWEVPECELLQQGHDALVVQFDEADEDLVVRKVVECAKQVSFGREGEFMFSIPVEASVGWNWGKCDPEKKIHQDGNPFGMIEYKGPGQDARRFEETPLLDRRFY